LAGFALAGTAATGFALGLVSASDLAAAGFVQIAQMIRPQKARRDAQAT
jgi:hypothetical protein